MKTGCTTTAAVTQDQSHEADTYITENSIKMLVLIDSTTATSEVLIFDWNCESVIAMELFAPPLTAADVSCTHHKLLNFEVYLSHFCSIHEILYVHELMSIQQRAMSLYEAKLGYALNNTIDSPGILNVVMGAV